MMMMTSGSSIRGDSGSGSRSRMMWASIQKVEHVDRQLSVWRGDRNDTRERFLWSEVSWLSSMTDSDRGVVNQCGVWWCWQRALPSCSTWCPSWTVPTWRSSIRCHLPLTSLALPTPWKRWLSVSLVIIWLLEAVTFKITIWWSNIVLYLSDKTDSKK